MLVTTLATSLYLYFWALCQVIAFDCKEVQKLWHAVQKHILSAWQKIRQKSLDHLFDLNVFDSMLYIIDFMASVLSFFIWVAEVPRINYLLPIVLFFTDSAMFWVLIILQILSLIFICKNLVAFIRSSRFSWIFYFQQVMNYFIKGTNHSN